METAILHHAIAMGIGAEPAASGTSQTLGSTGSFASHLQHAMETNPDDTSGLKPAGHGAGSVKEPAGILPGKDPRPAKGTAATSAPVASPILVASANGPSQNPAAAATPSDASTSPSAGSMALSWLTAMLPDLAGAKPAKQGAPEVGAESSANTPGNPKTSGTKNQQASNAQPASPLSKEAASAANHLDPVRALTAPAASATTDAPVGGSSAAASAAPAQHAGEIQGVAQTAESAALSLLGKSTTAGAGAIPSVIESMAHAAPVVAASDGKAGAAVTGAAHSQAPAVPATQTPAKDTTSASASLTQTAATSAGTNTSQGVKAVNGISADGKNGGSQDAQSKGNNGSAVPGATGSSQAGASAAVANAAQTAANGFPAALAQGAAAGNSQPHTSAPAQGGTPQPTNGEKIAVALESGLPQAPVSAATLVQSQARSEMRVAVQTESMGAVELHAVLASGKLGASISVVSHEAHTLLNNDLPALQQVLTDQNLRIDHLTVVNAPMSSGAGAGDGRGFQSGDYNRAQGRDLRWYSPATPAVKGADEIVIPGSARRLSVRA